MALNGTTLGSAIATAGGVLDVTGQTKCGSLGSAFVNWLKSNTIVNNIAPANLTASGSSVTGTGRLSFGADATSFRNAITTALGVTDTAGLAIWLLFATAWRSHLGTNGRPAPTAFVANPSGGAVTGTGKITIASVMSPTLASQMSMPGAANITAWGLIEAAIALHLTTNGVVNTLGFTSPNGGGLLVGASTIT